MRVYSIYETWIAFKYLLVKKLRKYFNHTTARNFSLKNAKCELIRIISKCLRIFRIFQLNCVHICLYLLCSYNPTSNCEQAGLPKKIKCYAIFKKITFKTLIFTVTSSLLSHTLVHND